MNVFQKINLKGNKGIRNEGLESLSRALTKSKIIKVELDESNRSCNVGYFSYKEKYN